MAAATPLGRLERYDMWCAFCVDGAPVTRFRGKAACERCLEAFSEAGELWLGVRRRRPVEVDVSPWRLRELVRYLLGMGPRDYAEPLWSRALKGRAHGR